VDQAGGGWAELLVVQQALMADVAQAARTAGGAALAVRPERLQPRVHHQWIVGDG
jgi:hypothetical protein